MYLIFLSLTVNKYNGLKQYIFLKRQEGEKEKRSFSNWFSRIILLGRKNPMPSDIWFYRRSRSTSVGQALKKTMKKPIVFKHRTKRYWYNKLMERFNDRPINPQQKAIKKNRVYELLSSSLFSIFYRSK